MSDGNASPRPADAIGPGGSDVAGRSRRWRPRWKTVGIAVLVSVFGLLALGESDDSGHDSRIEDGSVTLGWSDNLPVYSPDGRSVAIVRFYGGRWAISAGPVGGQARWITSSEHGDGGPAWSPDGSRLVYYGLTEKSREMGPDWRRPPWRQSEGLYVVNRDGSGRRHLTDGDDLSPCWSADGRTIVFDRWTEWDSGVFAISVDGGKARLLARRASNPACSPSGSRIAYDDGERTIGVLDRESGSGRAVAAREGASSPAWSPDGRRLVFYGVAGPGRWDSSYDIPPERLEVYVVDGDGSRLERLTRDRRADGVAVWTPDGRIVFKTSRAGGLRVYVMNSDGSGAGRFRTPATP